MSNSPEETYRHLVKPCCVRLEHINGSSFNNLEGLNCVDTEIDNIFKPVTQIKDYNRPSNNELTISTYQELEEKIFPLIKSKTVLQLVKCDKLICEFGARLLSNECNLMEKQKKSAIVNTITELGKFVLLIREKINKTMSLHDFIITVKDDYLNDYVKEVLGFDKSTRHSQESSVVAKLTKCLIECADILQYKADMSKYVRDFKRLNDESEVKKMRKCRNSTKQVEEMEDCVDVECEASGRCKDTLKINSKLMKKRKGRPLKIWSNKEKEALVKHFKTNIESKLLPTRTEINLCKIQEPVLKCKTWKEILCQIKGEMRKYPEDNVKRVQNGNKHRSLQRSFEDIFELPETSKYNLSRDCFVDKIIQPEKRKPSSPVDEWLSKVVTYKDRHWPKVYSELYDDSEEEDFDDTISVILNRRDLQK